MATRISTDERARIIELFKSGHKRNDIAITLGRDPSSVSAVLRQAGHGGKSQKIYEPDITTLALLKKHRVGIVAKMTGETYSTVARLQYTQTPRCKHDVDASQKMAHTKKLAFLTDEHVRRIGEQHADRILSRRVAAKKALSIAAGRDSADWQGDAWRSLSRLLRATEKYFGCTLRSEKVVSPGS